MKPTMIETLTAFQKDLTCSCFAEHNLKYWEIWGKYIDSINTLYPKPEYPNGALPPMLNVSKKLNCKPEILFVGLNPSHQANMANTLEPQRPALNYSFSELNKSQTQFSEYLSALENPYWAIGDYENGNWNGDRLMQYFKIIQERLIIPIMKNLPDECKENKIDFATNNRIWEYVDVFPIRYTSSDAVISWLNNHNELKQLFLQTFIEQLECLTQDNLKVVFIANRMLRDLLFEYKSRTNTYKVLELGKQFQIEIKERIVPSGYIGNHYAHEGTMTINGRKIPAFFSQMYSGAGALKVEVREEIARRASKYFIC